MTRVDKTERTLSKKEQKRETMCLIQKKPIEVGTKLPYAM